ncbi:MAG: 16S rRNA (cytosine(1402)-N(4))-methyltransferase RsmH [Armatimonadota bacterium]
MPEDQRDAKPEVHQPVLLRAVLEYLALEPGDVIVDATVGSGGHAAAIVERIKPGGKLIGIDRDPDALARADKRLAGEPIILVNDDYGRLEVILDELGIDAVDGVLIDAGVSLEQLRTPERGFSFRLDGPLDMRMDPRTETTAADLVNRLPEDELARILWEYGGERRARSIARAVAAARKQSPITTTAQLAATIEAAVPARARPRRLHAATKSFMALRIAVNDELGSLRRALEASIHRTRPSGRIAVLSYHSLEGGEVKAAFRRASDRSPCPPFPSGRVRILTKKAIKPSEREKKENPRSRSATLRVAEKLWNKSDGSVAQQG